MPLAALLLILNVEGLAAFLWAALTPSESGQGVFLWLSPARLLFAALLLTLFLALLAVSILLMPSPGAATRWLRRLDAWLIDQRFLGSVLLILVAKALLISAAASAVLLTPNEYEAYRGWAPATFPLLHSLVGAMLPLLAFVAAACLELAIFFALRYRRRLAAPGLWTWQRIGPTLLAILIAAAVAFHWLALVFELRFFVNMPAWYWVFAEVPFGPGDAWFAAIALALLLITYVLLMARRRIALELTILAALALFLQFGVGLMGGGGMAGLRDRYFTTYHQAYIVSASKSDVSVLESVRRYEQLYGAGSFTGTKPPGLMAFYIGLDHLISGFPSAYDHAARFERLSNTVVWLFPVLAASMVWLLHAFARRLLADQPDLATRISPLLYALTPSVALFTFFADQAIYPLLFLLGVWFAVLAIRRQSLGWAFLLGAVLYAGAFFAFTLLPLYVFTGLYVLLHGRPDHPLGRFPRLFRTALSIAAGTLLMHVLSLAVLNYDFLPRFVHSMDVNHSFDFYLRVGQQPPVGREPFTVRLAQVARAAWVNNLDFAAAIGLPVYILFMVQSVRRVVQFLKGRAVAGDIILLALLGSFLVLNLAGTAQGEVPRLWLFWVPMFALCAACEIEPWVRRRPSILLALGLAQLLTLVLTFHFQDLRM